MKHVPLLLLSLFSLALFAQPGTVAIGSGNLEYPSMPIFSFYGYTYSQQIVPKTTFNEAGGTGGAITKLRYYCAATGSAVTPWNNWTIYIGHTGKPSFQGGDWVPVSQLSQVFSGSFTPLAGTWLEFEFDEPFVYNDIDNIVIAVDENAPGWTEASNAAVFYSYSAATSLGLRSVSDSVNFDPENLVGASDLFFQLPMLQLEAQMLGVTEVSRNQVLVYPNPSGGVFNIESGGRIQSVEVFDVCGRSVFEQSNGEATVDLSRLTPATYLMKVATDQVISTIRIERK